MGHTIVRPKDRAGWLEFREGGIGSSEISTIVGLNPYETPYGLWRRKRGIDPPKDMTFAMKAGHYLEDAVSRFWSDATGREVIKRSACDWVVYDDERPYLRVSPDRTYWLQGMPKSNSNKGILECKTTQQRVDENDIPRHWFCQVQYQLGVSGLEYGSIAWLCSGREFGYVDIVFVPDFFEWLVEEATRFWVDYVEGGVEPAVSDVSDVVLKYGRHTAGKVVEVGDDILGACEELKDIKGRIAALEERKEEAEGRIKMAFGDAEAISHEGRTIATWKAPKPGEKFDVKAFRVAHPELAKEFTVQTQGARRLIVM